jgi:excisionase family DNA binding protein
MSQHNYSISSSIPAGSTQENLLTPAEVATLFRVDPKTVTRWAKAGKLTSIRTLGGHRRYKESEVKELLKATTPNQSGGN